MFKHRSNLQAPPVTRMSTSNVNKAKYNVQQTNKFLAMPFDENVSDPDDDFVFPKRKLTFSSSESQPKRYVLDSSELCKGNKYQILSEHSYSSNGDGNGVDQSHEMDDSTLENQVNDPKLKIPPIFLHNVNNHQEIIKDVRNMVKATFSTQVRGQSLKVNLSNIDDFRNLTAFYDSSNIKYHTFQPLHDKKLEVIVRNVPTSLSENEIKTELTDQNYPVIRVTRLLNKNKLPLPLCAVDLENNDDGKAIFNLTTICFAVVSVEMKRKSRQIPQCTRCQRYGHTKNFCKLDPRCVRCTGQHHYSECPKQKTAAPQCVNCGESHTANYRGCQVYQKITNKDHNRGSPRNRHQNATEKKENTPSPPDLNSATHFPEIHTNFSPQEPSTSRVSFAKVTATSRRNINNSFSQEQSDDAPDTSVFQNFEQIILDVVKSFIPTLKKIISNVISSILSNGSGQLFSN